MGDDIRVLGVAGSLREASYNRSLLRAARHRAPPGMRIDTYDISSLPLYNGDVEASGAPASVTNFKQAIAVAHALLFVTPEYNHGVPGVMKNAVDWASRPARSNPLWMKPVGVIGASPGRVGTARGQSQLRQAFVFTNSPCMLQPEILVSHANQKFREDGALTDPETSLLLDEYLTAFASWIRRFQ